MSEAIINVIGSALAFFGLILQLPLFHTCRFFKQGGHEIKFVNLDLYFSNPKYLESFSKCKRYWMIIRDLPMLKNCRLMMKHRKEKQYRLFPFRHNLLNYPTSLRGNINDFKMRHRNRGFVCIIIGVLLVMISNIINLFANS